MPYATFSRCVILICVSVTFASFSPITAQDRNVAFDEQEAFRTQVRIAVKGFWIAVRDHSGDKMRDTIDPQYLERHKLLEGDFQFPKIATDNLHDLKIAADNSTVMCQIAKEDGSTSVVLLRLVKRGDQLFVQPPKPPARDSQVVVPWLLHVTLAT